MSLARRHRRSDRGLTEAYGFLAQILMRREQELYAQRAAAPGGWRGWREFVVDRAAPESEVITSFYLRPLDGGPIMGFKPGQYLTFQLDIPGHGQVVRNYSLSCVPGQDSYRISVKREGAPDDALMAQDSQRDIWYVHAALSGRHHAMKQHLKEGIANHPGVRSVVFYEFPDPVRRAWPGL